MLSLANCTGIGGVGVCIILITISVAVLIAIGISIAHSLSVELGHDEAKDVDAGRLEATQCR